MSNGFEGSGQLEVSGRPPPELAALRARTHRQAGRADLPDHEVPIELARAICGFRHDQKQSVLFTVAEPA